MPEDEVCRPNKIILYNASDYTYDCRSGESDDQEVNMDNEDGRKKRRRKRKAVTTICTTYCKFDIVRKVAKSMGMREVNYTDPWNILWTDFSVSVARVKSIKGFQRVNHFPGMAEICHKALLAKNLNRMLKLFPDHYKFFPRTWCFPTEFNEAVEFSKRHTGKTYILKPGSGCRGQGIQLTKNFRGMAPQDKFICQVYISKPFLVDGLKFDLRVYTLITSCDPLRVYVYNEGLARFATTPYRKPAGYNLSNSFMHLTNYSVNKYSSTFIPEGECGTKRRITSLNQWFIRNLYDIDEIWAKIDDVIIKTIISAQPIIKHSYQVSFPNHDMINACFELLGFDILLDDNLKPYVLEVNHSPSFNTDSVIDSDIKEALLVDTFKILNLAHFDTHKFMEEDKKKVHLRLIQHAQNKEDPQNLESHHMNLTAMQESQELYEERNIGNYRKVYPLPENQATYKKFFNQATVPETISSRVREEVGKLYREELEGKQKAETERMSPKVKRNIMKSPRKDMNELDSFKGSGDNSPNNVNSNTNRNKVFPIIHKSPVPTRPQHTTEPLKPVYMRMNFYEVCHGEMPDRRYETEGNYILNKIYDRLKESGYIKDSNDEDSKKHNISQVIKAVLEKKSEKLLTNSSAGEGESSETHNDVSWLQPQETGVYNVKPPEKDTKAPVMYRSQAAKEFLQFQKMKLLKQLQDLV